MGRTWRRVSEAVRQSLSTGGDAFTATSNARCEKMLQEAEVFSALIKMLEKDLQATQKNVAGQFENLRDLLLSPLPRVYVRAGEQLVPRGDGTATVGQSLQYDRLDDAPKTMAVSLRDEVLGPMQEWTNDLKWVQGEMRKLEALRLELDSRKRTVATLDKELSAQRERSARASATPVRASAAAFGAGAASSGELAAAAGDGSEPKLEVLIKKLEEKKERKGENLRENQASFDKLEELVFGKLEVLIGDASSLREYAATALLHIRDCFATAATAFDGLQAAPAGAAASPPVSPAPVVALAPNKKGGSLMRAFASKLGVGGGGGGGGSAAVPASAAPAMATAAAVPATAVVAHAQQVQVQPPRGNNDLDRGNDTEQVFDAGHTSSPAGKLAAPRHSRQGSDLMGSSGGVPWVQPALGDQVAYAASPSKGKGRSGAPPGGIGRAVPRLAF